MKKHTGYMIETDGKILAYVYATKKEAYSYLKRKPSFHMTSYTLGKIGVTNYRYKIHEVLIKVIK
jgi:hypothetical protein